VHDVRRARHRRPSLDAGRIGRPPDLPARGRSRHQLLRYRDSYSAGTSERIVGKLLKEFARRDEVVIATKVYFPEGAIGTETGPNRKGLSRKAIMTAIDASLTRLDTDHVDLYQIHRWDYDTPIEGTIEALHDVVKAGKARYIGASSMAAWQFAKA
jgi:aryl-alcohol dehydrogenase-like predicted oxidoreductase